MATSFMSHEKTAYNNLECIYEGVGCCVVAEGERAASIGIILKETASCLKQDQSELSPIPRQYELQRQGRCAH